MLMNFRIWRQFKHASKLADDNSNTNLQLTPDMAVAELLTVLGLTTFVWQIVVSLDF